MKITQKSSHSRKHSSYKIKGSMDGESVLISRSPQYHPRFKFKWKKLVFHIFLIKLAYIKIFNIMTIF